MQKIMVVALALLMAGCATRAELRQKEPVGTFTSSRSAQDVAACVLDRIENRGIAATMKPEPAGWSVSVADGWGGFAFVADVVALGSGSRTATYQVPSAALGAGAKYGADVAGCQAA